MDEMVSVGGGGLGMASSGQLAGFTPPLKGKKKQDEDFKLSEVIFEEEETEEVEVT